MKIKNNNGSLDWFNGNADALLLFRMFVDVAHIWDDLVDRDKPVSADDINHAFFLTLVGIPTNPVYVAHAASLAPLLLNAVMGYQVANDMEATGDEQALEVSHTLRYNVSQVFIYLITLLNGMERAREILPVALKEMVFERYGDYLQAHIEGDGL